MADKGYDSNEIVAAALARGIKPVIPPRSNRKEAREYDQDLLRHLVENAFLHLKQWQWQPVMPKGPLLSWLARSGPWRFGPNYFDDTI